MCYKNVDHLFASVLPPPPPPHNLNTKVEFNIINCFSKDDAAHAGELDDTVEDTEMVISCYFTNANTIE